MRCYRCYLGIDAFGTVVTMLIKPAIVNLKQLPDFSINVPTTITCEVFAVKPSKGYIIFTFSVDGRTVAASTDTALVETDTSNGDGSKKVTYSPSITLQKPDNGKQLMCSVTWSPPKETVTIQQYATVNILCKHYLLFVPMSYGFLFD
jgi:hypothetical protein